MDQQQKIELIGEVAHYISTGPEENEQKVIAMYKDNPDYDFLFPQSQLYQYFQNKKKEIKNSLNSQNVNIQHVQQGQQNNNYYQQQYQQQQFQNQQNQSQQMYMQQQQQYQQNQQKQQQFQQNQGLNLQMSINQQQLPQIQLQNVSQQNKQQQSLTLQQQYANAPPLPPPKNQENNNNNPQQQQNIQFNLNNPSSTNSQGNDEEKTKKKKKNKWSEAPPIANIQNNNLENLEQIQKQMIINQSINNLQNNPQTLKLPVLPPLPLQGQQLPQISLPQIPQQINNVTKGQKIIQLNPDQLLEQQSAGILAEVVKGHLNRLTLSKVPQPPYTPLNTDLLAKQVIIIERPKEMLKAKIQQMEELLQKDIQTQIQKREEKEKEAQKEKEMQELAMAGFEVENIRSLQNGNKNRDISKEVDELYGAQQVQQRFSQPIQSNSSSRLNQEMGVSQDGSALYKGGHSGSMGGLGSNTTQSLMSQDQFANYRKGRSYQYHVRAEERAGGSRDGVQLCYKCNRPGHIAKDCKFGLT